MAYTKKTWKNSETRLSAENLNTIENGLEAAATKADEAAAKAASNTTIINGHTTAINGLTLSLNGLTTTVNSNKIDANSKFTSVENRIAAVEQKNSTQDGSISSVKARIAAVEQKNSTQDGSISSLSNSVATINSNHSSLSSAFTSHKNSSNNPHNVTAAQTGAYSKTEINTLLAPIIRSLTSTAGSAELATASISNISTGEQNIIITLSKSSAENDFESSFHGGSAAMWYLTENSTATHTLNIAIDFEQFSSLLYNCSYEILNDIHNILSTISSSYTYPDNYITNMRYVSPVYAKTANGWALHCCDDAASGSFVTIILYSPSQHRYFLIPTGTNGDIHEHLSFYFLDNRYLLVCGQSVYKYSIDLAPYGDDLELYSLGFNNFDSSYSSVNLHQTTAHCASFILTDGSGTTIIPTTYIPTSNCEYVFNIEPSTSQCILGLQGYNQPYSATLLMQYAENSATALIALGKNIPAKQEESCKDLDIKVQRALSNLISTGTGDPDASTPGLLYFKYLP